MQSQRFHNRPQEALDKDAHRCATNAQPPLPANERAFRAPAIALTLLFSIAAWTNLGAATRPSAVNLNVLIARLQRHYQATRSFSAKFDETITRAGAPPLKRAGVIYHQKPGKLRWEFEGAQPETIVSDGKTIYDYDPGLNQVVETPLNQAFRSQAAATFLLGAGNLKRDFTFAPLSAPGSDGLAHVELTPKGSGQRLEIGIDPKTYNIASLTVYDPMGNKTELSFSSIELNQPQKASRFEFTPPSGADIVSSQGGR